MGCMGCMYNYIYVYIYIYILVGGFNSSEKYEFVTGKDYPIYEMENNKCSKPPTSICIEYLRVYIYICIYIYIYDII